MSLTLLTGGARSGKSAIAVRRATAYDGPVVFVATGEAGDDEMADRIARHRAERPPHWRTVEEPVALTDALRDADPDAFVVVDCLALWVSNCLGRDLAEPDIVAAASNWAAHLAARSAPAIVVTNEVGLGLVPMNALARAYRDALGRVNATVARRADLVQLVVAGHTLTLDPEPGA